MKDIKILEVSLKCLLYYFLNKPGITKRRRINASSEQSLMLKTSKLRRAAIATFIRIIQWIGTWSARNISKYTWSSFSKLKWDKCFVLHSTWQHYLPERSCMRLYDKFSIVKLKSFSSPKRNEGKNRNSRIFRRMLCFHQIQSLHSEPLKVVTTKYDIKL